MRQLASQPVRSASDGDRRLRRWRSGLVLTLLLTAFPVQAQPRTPFKIDKVRIGLPGGSEGQSRVRIGAWTPVYVELLTPRPDEYKGDWKGVSQGECELVVQTSDGDSMGDFSVPAPAMAPGEKKTVLTYYRPGDHSGTLRLLVRSARGSTVAELQRQPDPSATVEPDEVLYLSLGGQFSGLREALLPKKRAGGEEDPRDAERADRRMAWITSARELPERWLGYQGVDVVVLSTSNTRFLRELTDPQSEAAHALGEWVRRGGRLVLGVGKNWQEARSLFLRLGLKAATLVQGDRITGASGLPQWVGPAVEEFPGLASVETARLTLTGGAALVSETRGGKSWPLLADAPLGMGRVFLVAFDFDDPAFSRWKGQSRFWERVHGEMGPRPALPGGRDDRTGQRQEIGSSLLRGLESFDEVPVISFGWVAFFILVYILIVGPLDYWFLKKVVKRLELTWITFPLVVLVVSVAAYFTAYKIKGNQLRVNKVDVIDINVAENEVQGTTWLALFSPRVQAYTVGIEPVPKWGGDGVAEDRIGGGTLVMPLSAPDSSLAGMQRPATQSLFRRPYKFAEEASGLRDVPVPVWASRSFTASWRRSIKPGQLIAIEDFGIAPGGQTLTGKIENRLPVELSEVSLFYEGTWHRIDKLPVGGYRVNIDLTRQGNNVGQWMEEPFREVYSPRVARGDRDESNWRRRSDFNGEFSSRRVSSLMKGTLFYGQERNPLATQNNSGLRSLDQGWRLRGVPVGREGDQRHSLSEAILIGRAVVPPASAEEVSQDGVSPTRLWLGRLPGDEGGRDSLPGFLGQDTYVRIYIPVTRDTAER